MGCVSSHLLNHEDDFTQIGSSALGHHIVSLTSTTYGLLTLDPPTPPPRFTSDPPPEVINSWELMAGLDPTTDSFRFIPQPSKPSPFRSSLPNHQTPFSLEAFEMLCPPKGENKVVIYTTSLQGVRKTFDACNAVRAVMEASGVCVCERDISMDRGFREELKELMKGKSDGELVPPRVFVKGRYVGGASEVMKIVEEGRLGGLLQGLAMAKKTGEVCEGCGGLRFLPCFSCNGSCKMVMVLKEEIKVKQWRKTVVVQCKDCNENGLVHCPLCS